jgi:uncharacterized protein (TIGR03067 family)
MTRTLCLALALSAATLPLRAADDKEVLTGTWSVVKADEDGKMPDDLRKAKFVFKDADKLIIKLGDGTKPREVTYKLDPSKKPKQIDITYTQDGVAETVTGIYERDGGKLKLCVAESEVKERPTEFKSKSRKVTYIELTRDEQ